jgi:hypothetical protein
MSSVTYWIWVGMAAGITTTATRMEGGWHAMETGAIKLTAEQIAAAEALAAWLEAVINAQQEKASE